MIVTEVMATTVVSGLILYGIKRFDDMSDRMDKRLDSIENRLSVIEAIAPKRRNDSRIYLENSGIDV